MREMPSFIHAGVSPPIAHAVVGAATQTSVYAYDCQTRQQNDGDSAPGDYLRGGGGVHLGVSASQYAISQPVGGLSLAASRPDCIRGPQL